MQIRENLFQNKFVTLYLKSKLQFLARLSEVYLPTISFIFMTKDDMYFIFI